MWARNSRILRQAALVLAAVLSTSPTWAAGADGATAPGDAQSAVWTHKQLHFLFQGFTAHYSCDGLEDKIRHVVKELGARGDFEVHSSGCASPFGRPDPFPAVNIRMSVLEPASATAAATDVVGAHWQRVDLHLDTDPVWEAGDCELLEQIKQKLLPLFATRKVEFTSNCIPHQLTLGTSLTAELLMPDSRDTKAASAQ
jgi:hypothetical protein